jgi:hypothetical protein
MYVLQLGPTSQSSTSSSWPNVQYTSLWLPVTGMSPGPQAHTAHTLQLSCAPVAFTAAFSFGCRDGAMTWMSLLILTFSPQGEVLRGGTL